MSLRIIAGKYKGRTLSTPKTTTTRPTQSMVRGALFNICQDWIEGSHFLDLFAGSGAMGFEALSRGASHATFVEKERNALQCIRENIATLECQSQITVCAYDYRRALEKLQRDQQLFDIAYIDPPYDQPIGPILEHLIDHAILKQTALIFVEQRYTRARAYSSARLSCCDSRRFGDALLQQFVQGA